ncbi:hypothetical protein CLOM_g6396 [Closterium sp. NIES-68]|nr:hypothetical protein CLOM_g6396 [Closterium sp. NIES-68]GJP68560.1 hypothetical protein CLOP_g25244 [Closterium sp. NIES-67]
MPSSFSPILDGASASRHRHVTPSNADRPLSLEAVADWLVLSNGARFGLDIGGTLCKLVCYEPHGSNPDAEFIRHSLDGLSPAVTVAVNGNGRSPDLLKRRGGEGGARGCRCGGAPGGSSIAGRCVGRCGAARSGKRSAGGRSSLWRESHEPIGLGPGGGRLYFKQFETWHMDDFLSLVQRRSQGLLSAPHPIGATGGGARKFRGQFEGIAGVQLERADELQCLVRGIDFLVRVAPGDCYGYAHVDALPRGAIQRPGGDSGSESLSTSCCSSSCREGRQVQLQASAEEERVEGSAACSNEDESLKTQQQKLHEHARMIGHENSHGHGHVHCEGHGHHSHGHHGQHAHGAEQGGGEQQQGHVRVESASDWDEVAEAFRGGNESEGRTHTSGEGGGGLGNESEKESEEAVGEGACVKGGDCVADGVEADVEDGEEEEDAASDDGDAGAEREAQAVRREEEAEEDDDDGDEGDEGEEDEWEDEEAEDGQEGKEQEGGRGGVDVGSRAEESPPEQLTYPYLVVNIGSGVSILRVDAPGQFERVGGSSLGGSTFLGLAVALTGCTSFKEAMRLASRGDSTCVDMLVGDIYGGDYIEMGLAATTVASSLGKLVRPADKASPSRRPENLAKAVLLMVTNNIGSIAMLHARPAGVRHVLFTGSFMHSNKLAMRSLAVAMQFWSKGCMKAMFLRHNGHAGALGALLACADRHGVAISPSSKRLSLGNSLDVPTPFM